jgi:FAD/FMN-containing dehydrogenase
MKLTTLAGDETTVADADIDALENGLIGELLQPTGSAYEEARRVWNGMIDRRPALIGRCVTVDDVVELVNFARERSLLTAVRGGGHGVAGHAVCDGGLVIDLSPLRDIRVDPGRATARAGGGCNLGELDAATQAHGLATPLGVVTKTGIAGLTLAGGIGWLRRKHGLSSDNLVSVEIVTADGAARTASEEDEPDLFWAVRGGGGNFGVVTSLEYRLHPVGPEVAFCFVLYPGERAAEIARACAEYTDVGPDEISPLCVLGHVPELEEIAAEHHGRRYAAPLALYAGGAEEGTRVLQPLRELGDPIADFSGTMPYMEAQGLLDEDYPDGWQYYWKSVGLEELTDQVLDVLTAHLLAAPSHHSTIDVWYHGGALARVDAEETAFGPRPRMLLGYESNFEDPSASAENVAWVRDSIAELQPFSTGGAYLNFPGFLEEGEDLVRRSYGANYDRLAAIKARYDPDNLFRLNGNIRPAG